MEMAYLILSMFGEKQFLHKKYSQVKLQVQLDFVGTASKLTS